LPGTESTLSYLTEVLKDWQPGSLVCASSLMDVHVHYMHLPQL
jgi:hypothetical protein